MRTPLTADEVADRLDQLDSWQGDTEEIHKVFSVQYHAGVAIVNEVAQAAIELEHHPDIDNRLGHPQVLHHHPHLRPKSPSLDLLLVERIEQSAAKHGATTA